MRDLCEFQDELGDILRKTEVYGADIVAMPSYILGNSTYIYYLEKKIEADK